MTDEERKQKKAERDRAYYEKNKEKKKAQSREWIANNKERKLASSKAWRENNLERSNEIIRKSTAKRHTSGKIKEYELANYIAMRMFRAAKCRAKDKGVPFTLTVDDVVIPDVCPVLGIPLIIQTGQATDNSPSLDRIIPALGYVPGNVRVISNRANRIKYNATLEELQAVVHYLQECLTQ